MAISNNLRNSSLRSMICPSASITFDPAIVYFAPLKIGLTMLHPSCILPIEGRSGSKPFPSTGKSALSAAEGLDKGDSLSHMAPFSFAAGVREFMNHFLKRKLTLRSRYNLYASMMPSRNGSSTFSTRGSL